MRWPWLRAVRAAHDGVTIAPSADTSSSAAASVAAALPLCAVFPGRAHQPYSLGSVLGAAVARFLPLGLLHAYCATLDVAPQAQVLDFVVDDAGTVHLCSASGITTARRPEQWATSAAASSPGAFDAAAAQSWGKLIMQTSAACTRVNVCENGRVIRAYVPACLVRDRNDALYIAKAERSAVTLFHLGGKVRQTFRCETGDSSSRYMAFCELTTEVVIGHSRGVTTLHIPTGATRLLSNFWRVSGVAVHHDTLYVADDSLTTGFIRHICVYR